MKTTVAILTPVSLMVFFALPVIASQGSWADSARRRVLRMVFGIGIASNVTVGVLLVLLLHGRGDPGIEWFAGAVLIVGMSGLDLWSFAGSMDTIDEEIKKKTRRRSRRRKKSVSLAFVRYWTSAARMAKKRRLPASASHVQESPQSGQQEDDRWDRDDLTPGS